LAGSGAPAPCFVNKSHAACADSPGVTLLDALNVSPMSDSMVTVPDGDGGAAVRGALAFDEDGAGIETIASADLAARLCPPAALSLGLAHEVSVRIAPNRADAINIVA